jgi:hypothetical protein
MTRKKNKAGRKEQGALDIMLNEIASYCSKNRESLLSELEKETKKMSSDQLMLYTTILNLVFSALFNASVERTILKLTGKSIKDSGQSGKNTKRK